MIMKGKRTTPVAPNFCIHQAATEGDAASATARGNVSIPMPTKDLWETGCHAYLSTPRKYL